MEQEMCCHKTDDDATERLHQVGFLGGFRLTFNCRSILAPSNQHDAASQED